MLTRLVLVTLLLIVTVKATVATKLHKKTPDFCMGSVDGCRSICTQNPGDCYRCNSWGFLWDRCCQYLDVCDFKDYLILGQYHIEPALHHRYRLETAQTEGIHTAQTEGIHTAQTEVLLIENLSNYKIDKYNVTCSSKWVKCTMNLITRVHFCRCLQDDNGDPLSQQDMKYEYDADVSVAYFGIAIFIFALWLIPSMILVCSSIRF